MAKQCLRELISELRSTKGIIRQLTRDIEYISDEECLNPKKRPFMPRRLIDRPDYDQSPWAHMLSGTAQKNPSLREGKLFRRRFRVPYPVFEYIVRVARERKWFVNKNGMEPARDAFGRKAVPLELKVLSVLRILGRGGVFDDAYDGSGMSEETCRRFLHSFCEKFAVDLFDRYVHPPESEDEIKSVMDKYEMLGLPGAIGSVDCTHVRWDMCPASIAPLCRGKEKSATLVYETVCDHDGRIHSVTRGQHGAHNDKTVVKFDDHVMSIHE